MKVLFNPQFGDDYKDYKITFQGEVITIKYQGKKETFNFTDMPNGVGEVESEVFNFTPIKDVKKINGELWVEIHKIISIQDSTHEERYPSWIEV